MAPLPFGVEGPFRVLGERVGFEPTEEPGIHTVKHLHRYLGEFDFRYSTRKISDSDRTRMVFKKAMGKRMSYRPL